MALNESLFVTKNPILLAAPVTFANADSTTAKTLYTAPSTGVIGAANADEAVRITNIPIVSSDTSAREAVLIINNGADMITGFMSIPANSGNGVTAANPSINLLNAIPNVQRDGAGNPYIDVPRGTIIKVNPRVAITATFLMTFSLHGYEFKA